MCFLPLVKMHALFQHTTRWYIGIVSQQSERCIFRCVASAAHFLIYKTEVKNEKYI